MNIEISILQFTNIIVTIVRNSMCVSQVLDSLGNYQRVSQFEGMFHSLCSFTIDWLLCLQRQETESCFNIAAEMLQSL